MGLFRRKPVLEREAVDWIFDTYEWALNSFGSNYFHGQIQLVRPTDEFFPEIVSGSDELAEKIFKRVRKYAFMDDWPCQLVAQEEDSSPVVSPTVIVAGAPSGPAGTFSVSWEDKFSYVTISYNPSQLKQPELFVATLAHELAHYLMHNVTKPPPGAPDLEEPATDLVSIFMGFGIFSANSAFSFNQFAGVDAQGWQTKTQGYLSVRERSFALALFLRLKNIEYKNVAKYLEKTPREFVKKSYKELELETLKIEYLRTVGDSLV